MYLHLNLDPQKLIVNYKKPHYLSNIFNILDIKIYVKYFPNCTLALEAMSGNTPSVTYEVQRPERVANKMFKICRSFTKRLSLREIIRVVRTRMPFAVTVYVYELLVHNQIAYNSGSVLV